MRVKTHRSLPNGTPSIFGRVLNAGTLYATLAGTHDGSTGSIGIPIPLQTGFCGLHFAAQALVGGPAVGPAFRFSSAVEGTTGTF